MELCLKKCFLCSERPLTEQRTHFQPHPVPSGGFPTTVNYHPNPPGQERQPPQVLAWPRNQSWQTQVPKLPNL